MFNKVCRKVLEKIKPTEEEKEKMHQIAKELSEKIKKRISFFKGFRKVVFAGSSARGTFLKGEGDIDLFVLFSKEEEINFKEIIFLLSDILDSYEEAYAQHPYLKGKYKGFDVEIVPAYEIKEGEKIKSATDRTPLHNEFLKKTLSEKQKDDVLLLKKLLKANDLYGAEIKVKGFSGYLCELLILYYGSFENLLKKALSWRPGIVLSFKGIPETKFNDPLIFIDPIDNSRNVASPLSYQNFHRFIALAYETLTNPREELFFGKKVAIRDFNEVYSSLKMQNTLLIEIFHKELPQDTIWGILQSLKEKLKYRLEGEGFKVIYLNSLNRGKSSFIFIQVEERTLSENKKVYGPKVYMFDHFKKFLEKHENFIIAGPRIEEDRWVLEVFREKRSVEEYVYSFLNNFLENKRVMRDSKFFFLDKKRFEELYKEEWFATFVNKCMEGKEPWI